MNEIEDKLGFVRERFLEAVGGTKSDFEDDAITPDEYWETVGGAAKLATILLALQSLKPSAVPTPPPERKRKLDL